MKGINKMWMIGLILLVLSAFIASALTLPGFEKISGVSSDISSGIDGVTQNFENTTFVYVFFAVAIVIFYFAWKIIPKNKSGVIAGIIFSLFASYSFTVWRMKSNGWFAYMCIIIMCIIMVARKTSSNSWGGSDSAGIDAGLAYGVAAGVLAPFSSLAEGIKPEISFFTHVVIGTGFPMAWVLFFGKRGEEGKGLLNQWNKKKEDKKQNKKENKEKIEALEIENKHLQEESEKSEKRHEELMKRFEEFEKKPYDQKAYQQVAQTMQAIPATVPAAPINITVNAGQEQKKANDLMNITREGISLMENRFTDTPEGRAAKYVAIIAENTKRYGNPYLLKNKIFGENMNDDRPFMTGLINYSKDASSLRVFKDIKRRLEKCKIKALGGVIEADKFVTKFAEPLIKDYEKQKHESLKVLRKELGKEADAGAETVQAARAVEKNITEFNQMAAYDRRAAEAINMDEASIKNLLQQIDPAGGRAVSPEQLAVIVRNIDTLGDRVKGELELKAKNEENMEKKAKAVMTGFKTYIVKSEKGDNYLMSIPYFAAIDSAYGEEKAAALLEKTEEPAVR
jgi:hypothetical protein